MTHQGATLKGHGLPDYYARQALEKLARHFRIPPEERSGDTAVVGFRIARDGTLTRVRIITSSGSAERDRYAIDAVNKAERLAPFPDDFNKEFLDVEVAFRFV